MRELKQIAENSYYIDAPVCTGIISQGKDAFLIDTGNDKDNGRKLLKDVDSLALEVHSIVNTHSHADHIGGNRLIQRRTDCDIFSSLVESYFINNPSLEGLMLYGAHPPKSLQNKFFLAQASRCKDIKDCKALEHIDLPGHSPAMIGVISPDDILYVGDVIADVDLLDKHGIYVVQNVENMLNSLNKLKELNCKGYVLSHGGYREDIKQEIAGMENHIKKVIDFINEMLPASLDEIITETGRYFEAMTYPGQYYLVRSTIGAYLSYGESQDLWQESLKEEKIYWK